MNQVIEMANKLQDINHLSDRKFAKRLGIDATGYSRIKRSLARPGMKFLNALVREFPETSLVVYEAITKGRSEEVPAK